MRTPSRDTPEPATATLSVDAVQATWAVPVGSPAGPAGVVVTLTLLGVLGASTSAWTTVTVAVGTDRLPYMFPKPDISWSMMVAPGPRGDAVSKAATEYW